MQMFIPRPGNMIRLTADWHFPLYHEYRNTDLSEGLELANFSGYAGGVSSLVKLPKGTVLKIDRLYIKGPYPEYDSVTFRTVASPDGRLCNKKMGGIKGGKSRRFWAKLADVNNIEYERADDVSTG